MQDMALLEEVLMLGVSQYGNNPLPQRKEFHQHTLKKASWTLKNGNERRKQTYPTEFSLSVAG